MDILQNREFKLDHLYIASFVEDLINVRFASEFLLFKVFSSFGDRIFISCRHG